MRRPNSRIACVNITLSLPALSPPFHLLNGGVKQTLEVKNRGYGFLVPIGKMLTQHEEKNDVRADLALHSRF
jgi:hypothetical protein